MDIKLLSWSLAGVVVFAFFDGSHAAEPTRQQSANSPYPIALLERQYVGLMTMPAVDVTYTRTGAVRRITGRTNIKLTAPDRLKEGDSGQEILQKFGDVLLAAGTEKLTVQSSVSAVPALRTIALTQSIRNIPVVDAGIAIGVDGYTDEVVHVVSYFLPDQSLPRSPKIAAQAAIEFAIDSVDAQEDVEKGSAQIPEMPTLAYFGGVLESEAPALVWVVQVEYMKIGGPPGWDELWVDASDGRIRSARSLVRAALNRTVYSANNTWANWSSYPNNLTFRWSEGAPLFTDPLALSAYHNVATAFDAWKLSFGHEIGPIGIVAHYGVNDSTGYYKRVNGVAYLSFGDGSSSYSPPSQNLDVVAHEYGHGVFESRVSVWSAVEWDDGPAIDEGYGDFSAVMTDAYTRGGQVHSATWQIMETKLPGNTPVRSWSNPKLTSPTAVDWYIDRSFRTVLGTRHGNSHVLGHAYYLLTTGGYHVRQGQPLPGGGTIPAIYVPALGHNQAKNIFFAALAHPDVRFYPDYSRLRTATEYMANQLYSVAAKDAVSQAWAAVGLGQGCTAPPATPNPTVTNHYCMGRYDIEWPRIPGVKYHGMVVPSNWYWDVHGRTTLDAYVGSCGVQVTGPSRFRMRACNACGCSAWTHDYIMQYYAPCL